MHSILTLPLQSEQMDARIRCVLSDLGLVGRDSTLDNDALHKLIDGIVTDEQVNMLPIVLDDLRRVAEGVLKLNV